MSRRMKPHQLVIDVVLAGLFALAALWWELSVSLGAFHVLSSVLTCLLLAVALAVRRRSPAAALAFAWVGAFAQMAFGRPPVLADVAIFAVLYAVAAYGSRATFWAGFGSSILGAVVITTYLLLIPDFAGGRLTLSTLPIAIAVLLAAGFALLLSWTVGALVRTALRARANREAQERAEAEAVVEQERVRIARDMHDIVAHSLAVIIAQADGARYASAVAEVGSAQASASRSPDPAVATAALGTISSTARSALSDVRLLLTQLRHPQDDVPQPTIADLEQLYAQVRASGVELRIDAGPVPPEEPPAVVQLALYRILQEALTNALRHGAEGSVSMRLAWFADRVELEVRNAVRPGTQSAAPGHGLIGMGERASLIGGRLTAGDSGDSFVVNATLPIGSTA